MLKNACPQRWSSPFHGWRMKLDYFRRDLIGKSSPVSLFLAECLHGRTDEKIAYISTCDG